MDYNAQRFPASVSYEISYKGDICFVPKSECSIDSAALSIRLTRLKPRGPPRAGAHQEQGPTKSRGSCNLLGEGSKEARSLGVNTALWIDP